ncbi:MAG: ATP-binding cassette domain-containing protein [Proteobacteria bacterium]|nr:ATP-binding cassette domain-containing protein [Pseudomonadota bacterium]
MNDLRLEKVTKRYGDLCAILDFNLSVPKGEYLFILGPSGCGKSVLLRLIAGLEMPSSGAIYARDLRINEIPAHKRNIPVVFQNFGLFPHLPVRENIGYGLKIKGIDESKRRKKCDDLLEMLNISDMALKKPHQLSAGQRQRVGLGRALAVDPAILLLDEPLGALDANLHINMQFELKKIQKELGVTFLQVTHNHSDALAVADRIVVMNRGSIEQVGTPSEIFSAPMTRFVAGILESNNIFDGKVIGKEGESMIVDTQMGRFFVPVREAYPPLNADVTFVVRHDRLLINPSRLDANTFEAEFKGRTVQGSLAIYEFLSKDRSLKVETHLSAGLLSARPGDRFTLGWIPSHGHLLPLEN